MISNVTSKNPGWTAEALQPYLDKLNTYKAVDWRRFHGPLPLLKEE